MAETTADVRRDIELTRERMSSTLTQLEHKLNLGQMVRDHPWPALAIALGAGLLLSGSEADVKAAAATAGVARGARTKVGAALDDMVATLVTSMRGVFEDRLTSWTSELRGAVVGPRTRATLPERAD